MIYAACAKFGGGLGRGPRAFVSGALLAMAMCGASGPAAFADHGPVLVIPAVPGVPVIIAHREASYAVVEGDWGLFRPGAVTPTMIRRWDDGETVRGRRHYFPGSGIRPGYGRLEINPPADRRRPPAAESFRRVWSAGSLPVPASEPVPYDPPQVILAPRDDERGPRRPHPVH